MGTGIRSKSRRWRALNHDDDSIPDCCRLSKPRGIYAPKARPSRLAFTRCLATGTGGAFVRGLANHQRRDDHQERQTAEGGAFSTFSCSALWCEWARPARVSTVAAAPLLGQETEHPHQPVNRK